MIELLLIAAAAGADAKPACAFDPDWLVLESSATPTPQFEARNNEAFKGENLALSDGTYVKSGPPREFAPFELAGLYAAANRGEVPVFRAEGEDKAEEGVVYVMVNSAACLFQVYAREE